MDYTILGRTGLKVSRMGLGCGGHSRLGMSTGSTESEAIAVVQAALDLGVNFIDTAESYRTEEIVGRAIKGVSREQVVLSTKAGPYWQEAPCPPNKMKERVEASLMRLQTDYIDVFHLHGVTPEEYAHALDPLVPCLQDLQAEGKIRFIGITEQFITDNDHRMLQQALKAGCWDVMMVGHSLLNRSARHLVLAATQRQNIGTLCMFAVRRALSRPEALKELMSGLVAKGTVDEGDFDPEEPLWFLLADGTVTTLAEAGYRFCRHEPGLDVILSGTGKIAHLKENYASLMKPPLSAKMLERLEALFGKVDCVSGN